MIKLNTMKLVSLIALCVFGLLAILGLAFIGVYLSDSNTDSHSDGLKSGKSAPGVLIFGASVRRSNVVARNGVEIPRAFQEQQERVIYI